MANLTNVIGVQIDKDKLDLQQYFTKEEQDKTSKELIYIEKHLNKYNRYNNILELKEDLLKK